jgi:sodium/proline symporter
MEKMTSTGAADHLSAHYLGGRSFGPIITAGTIFASLFSGYTVVGIPDEAYNKGWTSLRWMPTTCGIVLSYIVTGLRLRKLSLIRNHQSPIDFITDR